MRYIARQRFPMSAPKSVDEPDPTLQWYVPGQVIADFGTWARETRDALMRCQYVEIEHGVPPVCSKCAAEILPSEDATLEEVIEEPSLSGDAIAPQIATSKPRGRPKKKRDA